VHRPRLFIGSSTEGLAVAKALQVNLDRCAEVSVWTNNIFELSQTTLASLRSALDNSDYGVFVFTPDDEILCRGTKESGPRDNVIFELGLFSGRLGFERTFVVKPRNTSLKLPSDLIGLNLADYEPPSGGNIVAALGSASSRIELIIQKDDALRGGPQVEGMTWDQLCKCVAKLGDQLKRSPHDQGFMPDLIIGVSRGGIIVADLLSRFLGGRIPTQCLWADRHTKYQGTTIASPKNGVNDIFKHLIKANHFRNILLVDDISRRGVTINESKKFVQRISSRLTVKTLLLVIHKDSTFKPDFYGEKVSAFNYRLPFTILG
jgi:hypoxanthine phosphoribosyltransferase